jgi:hypothetical protein
MNQLSAPHVGPPLVRSSVDRPFAALEDRLREAKRLLLSRWHDYQVRRAEARSLVAVSEMDAHMLRDIGAPDQMIAQAAERSRIPRWIDDPFRMSMVLVAIAAIGMSEPAPAAEAAASQRTVNAYAQGQMVGVFTGEFVNGAPVYRFPTVVVAAPRSAAPAGNSVARVAHPRQVRVPAKGSA